MCQCIFGTVYLCALVNLTLLYNLCQWYYKKELSSELSLSRSVVATRSVFSERLDNPYHEPLAKLFAGEEHIEEAHRKIALVTGGKTIQRNEVSTVVSRHMLIDKFLHDATTQNLPGPRQVVILGAGFDSRANRLSQELPVQKWFEIDLPAPQQFKEDVLRNNDISDPVNLVRIKLDLTAEDVDWLSVLEHSGWDPTAPTIFILEGLVYYMSTEQAKQLLRSIPSVPSSRIIVTIIEHSLQKVFERYGRSPWKTNLRQLKRAGGLQLPEYKMVREALVPFPQRYGLKVSVPTWPTKNLFERIQMWIHTPCERVFEFEAV